MDISINNSINSICVEGGCAPVNLITNGTFDTDTSGWSANGIITVVDGKLQVENGTFARAKQSFATQSGVSYTLSLDFEKVVPNVLIRVGTGDSLSDILNEFEISTDTYTYTFTASTTTTYLSMWLNSSVSGETALFDNISVYET